MKKTIFSVIMLTALLSLTSCFSDDSKTLGELVSDIEVTGIENSYVKTAFVENLDIVPVITTAYNDLSYEWLLLTPGNTIDDEASVEVIGTEKDLHYEVGLAPGTYQVRLNVKSLGTNYTRCYYTTLTVQTQFSSGFYILKETAEGKTDVDLFTMDNIFIPDMLVKTQGQAMEGKPSALNIVYDQYYIDEKSNTIDKQNTVVLVSDAKQIQVHRTSDFAKIFDRSNLLFDEMEADEVPYGIFNQGMWGTVYASNKGFRYTNNPNGSFYTNPTSGKFGFPMIPLDASTFMAYQVTVSGMYYWDQSTHSLMMGDTYLDPYPVTYKDGSGTELTQNLSTYKPLSCGTNFVSRNETDNFILENTANGKRYVYLMSSARYNSYLTKYLEVPAYSKMAKANCFATNGISARYIYFATDNKLYGYAFNTDEYTEAEMSLQGIGSGEQIVYLENLFYNGSTNKFDYLVVGTQKGNDYKLYMYEMPAGTGTPTGAPVKTCSGTGKLKSVRSVLSTANVRQMSYGYTYFYLYI